MRDKWLCNFFYCMVISTIGMIVFNRPDHYIASAIVFSLGFILFIIRSIYIFIKYKNKIDKIINELIDTELQIKIKGLSITKPTDF